MKTITRGTKSKGGVISTNNFLDQGPGKQNIVGKDEPFVKDGRLSPVVPRDLYKRKIFAGMNVLNRSGPTIKQKLRFGEKIEDTVKMDGGISQSPEPDKNVVSSFGNPQNQGGFTTNESFRGLVLMCARSATQTSDGSYGCAISMCHSSYKISEFVSREPLTIPDRSVKTGVFEIMSIAG